tara:strand:- start:42 stop:917 length:876 start_codon:yes stop_codon:yes gene_type:complete
MDFGMSQSDMESIQSGLDPESTSERNDGEETGALNQLSQKNYTNLRGATAKNPFPESFFSQMFGVDNVDYTNILGGGDQGSARIKEINSLRYNQGMMGMSNETGSNTGNPYTQNDYYIGQPTTMGEVKPIPSTVRDFMNFMPAGGIINAITGQPGLPELTSEYKKIMNEQKQPGIMSQAGDFFNKLGTDTSNLFTGAFGAKTPSAIDSRKTPPNYYIENDTFSGKPQLRYDKTMPDEQRADLNLNDVYNYGEQAMSKKGAPLFNDPNLRFNLGTDKNFNPQAKFSYNFATG